MKRVIQSLIRLLRRPPYDPLCLTTQRRTWRPYIVMIFIVILYAERVGTLPSPVFQPLFIRQFHLIDKLFVQWNALQTVPTMYAILIVSVPGYLIGLRPGCRAWCPYSNERKQGGG